MPTDEPRPPADPAFIVAKVDDRGTADRDDNRLLPGATFEVRPDDGDGVYEPNGDDAPALGGDNSSTGFTVYAPDAPGRYWVAEVVAPAGYDMAASILVDYPVPDPPENCVVIEGSRRCQADDDGTGGFIIVVVFDSPTGGVAPTEATTTLPPTSTVEAAATTRPADPAVIAAALAAVVALAATWHRQSQHRGAFDRRSVTYRKRG